MFDLKKFFRKYLAIFSTGIFFAVLPLFISPYNVYVFTLSHIFLIAAASFDIFSGYIGEINFGYALSMGIGAYTTALLGYYYNVSPVIGLVAGGALAALAALALGGVCLRLKGPYFVMAMIAVSEAARLIIEKTYTITKGDDGMAISPISTNVHINYYFSLALAISTVFVFYVLANSRIGLTFKTIREDSMTSEAVGVNVALYKIIAFTISAFMGGVAGSYYAIFQNIASPGAFSLATTTDVFFTSYIGGSGTIIGAILGSYILIPLTQYLRGVFYGVYRYVFYAIVLIIMIKFARNGLYGLIEAAYKKMRAHTGQTQTS